MANLEDPEEPNTEALLATFVERDVEFTDWAGWLKLNAFEQSLGEKDTSAVERERVKIVDRDEMVKVSRS